MRFNFCIGRSLRVAASLILGVSLITSLPRMIAQCGQQPQIAHYSVPPFATVYYRLDSSLQDIPKGIGSSSPISQIQAAFAAWTSANTANAQASGTSFVLESPGHPATVIVNSDPNYKIGDQVAQTAANGGIIDSNNVATITFHPYSFVANSSSNAYQVFQPGYDSAYFQTALHEIGHVMGIGDYDPPSSAPPPSPTSSVVSPFIDVNDQGNTFQKAGPTPCDEQEAASSTAFYGGSPFYYYNGSGSPDKGDGTVPQYNSPGDNGSSGGNCDWNEYWDDSSNTLYAYCS